MACSGKVAGVGRAVVVILCLLVYGAPRPALAQKEQNIWYFGPGLGLDFNNGTPPKVLTDGAMDASEGTASIADANGKLLFYSDGTAVWNKNHQLMANGDGLLGSANSAQSSLIVKQPGNNNIYFLFTTDSNGKPNSLRYSTIDMSRKGGLGEVIKKNTSLHALYSPVTEGLTAVRHANGRDIWVVVKQYGRSDFRSFLVDAAGVDVAKQAISTWFSDSFIIPEADPVHAIGCMKLSPDGTRMAVVNLASNSVKVFRYSTTTGHMDPILTTWGTGETLTLANGSTPYGVEFSPDNTKLYVSTDAGTRIYQYDLSLANVLEINDKATLVAQVALDPSPVRYVGGSLQLAPDGKIYFAKPASGHLAVIHNPNAVGAACNYEDKAIYLEGRKSNLGLPAFVQSSFYFSYEIKYTINCFGIPSQFYFDAPTGEQPDFMEWDFGDPATGASNKASTLNASHSFSAPGEYTVTFKRHYNNKQEIYSITIPITAPPVVDLGPDRSVCPGTEATLDATTPNATYKWSNGSTTASITTNKPGTYWVDVTVGICTTRDQVTVSNYTLPTVNLGPDKELCEGQALELNAFYQGATYKWQDGSTAPTFTVTKAGTYSVEVTSAEGCTKIDEITISYNPLPIVDLGPDQDICANTTITLDATQAGVTYKWSTGATTPTITVAEAGEYFVTITNSKGCNATDVIRINHLPLPVVNLGPDVTLCSGDTKLLDATYPNSTYLWQDGSTDATFMVQEPGKYWVDVTNEFGCVVRDEIWIPYLTRPAISLGNDTTLCFGDTLVVGTELPGDIRYVWQDGSTDPLYKITKPGTYKLTAYNQHCEASDEITVRFKDCVGGLFIPNIITPNGDGKNDVFYIHGLTEDDWELVIFNRQGSEIYRRKNYKNDWVPQPVVTGIYYYLLQHPATGRTYKGWVEVTQ